MDETLLVFDSTVFSAADREATHLLDGLLRHAVRPTDVHSTATHGYTEVIFAVPRMLGIAYEPRIRQLTNQQLYSWEPVATLSPFAVFSYRHLNLHGEYDFSDQPLPAEAGVLVTTGRKITLSPNWLRRAICGDTQVGEVAVNRSVAHAEQLANFGHGLVLL